MIEKMYKVSQKLTEKEDYIFQGGPHFFTSAIIISFDCFGGALAEKYGTERDSFGQKVIALRRIRSVLAWNVAGQPVPLHFSPAAAPIHRSPIDPRLKIRLE